MKIKKKPHAFYPLVVFCERSGINSLGKEFTTRWIERNTAYDDKHDAERMHILYARQVAKLQRRRFQRTDGKSIALMELPYATSDLTCDKWPCHAENEYHRISPNINLPRGQRQSVDAMAIIDAELGHEDHP